MLRRTKSWSVLRHLAWVALSVACTHEPRARTITGPDGSPMLHVACGADQGACFELAGRGCPGGYEVFPIFDAHDNNFLIRCRGVSASIAALPQPMAAPGTPSTNVFAPAPPTLDARPEGVSVAAKPPPTIGTRNDSEIDVGY